MTEDGKKLYEYAKVILSHVDLIRDIKGKDALQTLAVASYPLISNDNPLNFSVFFTSRSWELLISKKPISSLPSYT